MANTKVTGALIADATITATNIADGAVTAAKLTGITTTSIAEGDKLFYTDARVGTYLTGNGYDTAANIIATITDSAPVTLDTLNELAAALGDDPNYATTTANLIGTKLPLTGGTLTGALSFQDTSIPSAGTARIFSRDTNSYLYLQTGSGNQIQLLDGSQNTLALFNPSLVSFSISNSERMRIDSSGNVGIGTNTPEVKLSLYNNASQGNPSNHTPGNATLKIQDSSNTMYIDGNSIIQTGAASFTFGNTQASNILFYTDATERLRIDSSGNVGIGTTSPQHTLDINGTVFIGDDGTYGSDYPMIGFGGTTNGSPRVFGGLLNGKLYLTSGTGDSIVFRTNGASENKMVLDTAGNLGIGTTSPSAKLHVVGSGENGGILFNVSGQQEHRLYSSANSQFNAVGSSTPIWHWVQYTGVGVTPNYKMTLNNTGLGIGTTSPSEKLEVNGTIAAITSSYPTLKVQGSDVNYQGRMRWDTNNNVLEFLTRHAGTYYSDTLVLKEGNVGIGTNSPSYTLDVNGKIRVNNGQTMQLGSMAEQYPYRRLDSFEHDGSGYFWGFGTKYGSVQKINAFFVGQSRTFHAVDALEVVTWSANEYNTSYPSYSTKARIDSDGMKFNGDTAAANALDDYEEGTFTPEIGDGTYTYSYRRGHYVKIGNLVHVHIGFKLNTASPGSSTARINGLPFTGANYGAYQEPHTRVGVAGECVTANLSYNLSFYLSNNSGTLYARTSEFNSDSQVNSNQLWKNGTFIKYQLIYTVS